jgi:hypothetical protein
MDELKSCPFCGGELQLYPSHVEGQYIVNKPGGVCKKCGMIFVGRGYRIYGEVKSEDFHDEKFFELWNTRPAEDALKAEVERLKSIIEELTKPRTGGIKAAVQTARKEVLFGTDTNVPAKESEKEDE